VKGITYRNTKTTLPNWVDNIHIEHPMGYAYETDSHFMYLYGRKRGFYVISIGLTAIEKKEGTLRDWAIKTFGAADIKEMNNHVGHSIKGVWGDLLYTITTIHIRLLM
jgi:hypothetical protein